MPRKTFNIDNEKALEKIESQQNQSKYLVNLVLNDINSRKNISEEEVLNIIKECFKKMINTL